MTNAGDMAHGDNFVSTANDNVEADDRSICSGSWKAPTVETDACVRLSRLLLMCLHRCDGSGPCHVLTDGAMPQRLALAPALIRHGAIAHR